MNGTLLVEMAVQAEYRIPSNAKAEVQAVGLFGDAQIGLIATPSAQYYAKGDTIPAAPLSPGIPELTAKADSVATVAVDITKRLQSDLVASGGLADVRQALARTNALVAQIGAIAAEQSRQLTATQQTVRRSLAAVDSATIDSTLRSVRATAANAALLSDSLRATLAVVNATLGDLRSGKGTAGKLLTDSLLYADLRRLVTRVDSLTIEFQKNPRKFIGLSIF
jgi:phospholipid/cholesterol/gamma-HCH transport system substrate-binding protein